MTTLEALVAITPGLLKLAAEGLVVVVLSGVFVFVANWRGARHG